VIRFRDTVARILMDAGWQPGGTARAMQAARILREHAEELAACVELQAEQNARKFMRAKLLKDYVGIASGLPYPGRDAMSPAQLEMLDRIRSEYCKRADENLRAYDRKFSVPAQDVEVLDVFDQAENAHLFRTPTPHEIVALIRATNFDGETVETLVSVSDLDVGVALAARHKSASSLLDAFREWLRH